MSGHTKESRKAECLRNEKYILYWRGQYNIGDVFSDMFLDAMYDKARLDMLQGRKLMSFIGSEIPTWARPDVLVCGLGWRVKEASLRNRDVPAGNILYTRGRISRDRLAASGVAVPDDLPMGDTGLLASLIYRPGEEKKYDIGIITHHSKINTTGSYVYQAKKLLPDASVSSRCMGDLSMDCSDIFEFIASCRVVVSSSLHAIIFAHSFGVPALFFSDVDGYKFEDYYSVYERISYDDIRHDTSLEKALAHVRDEDFLMSVNPTREEVRRVQEAVLGALPYQECLSEFGRMTVHKSPRYMLMQCLDQSVLAMSSSGGVVPCLARNVIRSGGVYFGVTFSDDFKTLRYEEIDSLPVDRACGSKYIDVRLSDELFDRMKMHISSGRDVMFVGRPCQCIWLRQRFPGNRHLILVEILCFGVPEDSVWNGYVQRIQSRHGSLKSFNFRHKDPSWQSYGIKAEFTDGTATTVDHGSSQYMKEYLSGGVLKGKCRNCGLGTRTPSLSDIVCGDAWGIEKLGKDTRNVDRGWSLAIANTPAGGKLLESMRGEFTCVDAEFSDIQVLKRFNKGLSRAVGRHSDHVSGPLTYSAAKCPSDTGTVGVGSLLSGVSVEDLIRNSFCITVNNKRRNNITRIFDRIFGVTPMFFEGYTDNPNNRRNCDCGHAAIIKVAQAMNLPFVTIFEDDAFPRPDAKDLLGRCMRQLPDDAAMVLWGFGRAPDTLVRVNDYMQQAYKPDYLWGAHAYTVFSSCYDKYSELYPRAADQYWGLVGPTYVSTNCFIQFSSEDGVPDTPYFCSMKDLLEVDAAGDI